MKGYSLVFIQLLLIITTIASAQESYPGNKIISIDSSVTVFNDPSWKLTLHIFAPDSKDEEHNNAVVRLIKINQKTNDTLQFGSWPVYCQYAHIEFKDFNNDGYKDILVLHTSSARSNRSYYLYLTNNKKKSFVPVKGFSELLNPEINKKTGTITSYALYGDTQSFSFYKISKNGHLLPERKSYEVKIK